MNLRPQETLLDRLVESVRERGRAFEGEELPAAILWPDPGREWKRVVESARERLPELLVLGDYDPEARTGPAIWLRFVVDRANRATDDDDSDDDGQDDADDLEFDRPPILYLPGVGRQDLRAGEDCPDTLKPLVELLHRGSVWRHPNGKDWTAAGFLGSSSGVNLRLAEDRGAAEALRLALPELAALPLARFRDRLLQADDFHRLLVADLPRNLLRWLGDPGGARVRLGERWDAFRSQCRDDLDFDPEGSGADLAAGERLGGGDPAWNEVWERYCEAPEAFPGVALLLSRCPQPRRGGLFASGAGSGERWPRENDRLEESLRGALAALPKRPQPEACERVARLEAEHGARRGWVWARLGHSRLALALEPLARLAAAAKSPVGGADPEEIAQTYLERGWPADAAAWEAVALAAEREADEAVVSAAVRHLLEPWLHDSALAFQEAVRRKGLPGVGYRARDRQPLVEPGDDGCLFFVDGLRYDLGRRLAERLEREGLRVESGRRWAALPTVTATAKPGVTPVAEEIEGIALDDTFAPRFCGMGAKATAKSLREALEERGFQILGGAVFDAPESAEAHGWLETGEIDKAGHREQERLAQRIPGELDRLAQRIVGLLGAGWRSVRVVTDHGWLLLPGGLPREDLPKHLTETRWARCAVLAGKLDPGVPRYPWSWNAADWFAAAPGIACFNKSDAYAHGGVSLQECLTPDLLVEREEEGARGVSIASVTWRRFRCLLVIGGGGGEEERVAELRLDGPDGEPVSTAKPVDADGSVSLVLSDDEHEDAAFTAVVLDGEGRVLAAAETRVGEDS